ncbi:ankyrin repeat domain-containing protein [Aequorivita marisscotiae]|uniref:Ankyrin repeat domain-containing protein n=1 Tax=Aequorivita marisscotiae TaxID=3040348 RepID=A0ABY8KQC6_9FLAO|nr:ankyrin repeat domain-containing protein [Aequorivita sp. Ant34-E75]WGF91666.1 ankyrin repeat domain-containing protein [Aequorivita sp. Ant34-E75]
MKSLEIKTFKTTFPLLLLILLFTSACAQTDKKTTTSINTEVKEKGTKPSMDINTAVISGNLEAVKQHIEAGTDINQKEPMSGSTPLMSAATFDKPEIAKALIDAQADLSIKNNDGATALHSAAFFGRIEIVQMLLDAKADKTIKNNYGATPRESVLGNFAEMQPVYEMIIQQLKPMGFKLDLNELKKARPVVAMMLE